MAGKCLLCLRASFGNSATTNPLSPRVLLNWRGKPFSYQTVTFSDVFNDMTQQGQDTSAG